MDDIDDDDDDVNEDQDMRDATPEPDVLDEEIFESDLEHEGDIVQSEHDNPPQKIGDRSVNVTEENCDAHKKQKENSLMLLNILHQCYTAENSLQSCMVLEHLRLSR